VLIWVYWKRQANFHFWTELQYEKRKLACRTKFITLNSGILNRRRSDYTVWNYIKLKNSNSVAWASERTILIQEPPLVVEVSAFADRGCHLASVTYFYGRILGFPDQRRYFFFQVAPQFYSRGWVDPVPDPLLLRKSGSAGDRIRTSGSAARNSDH
jgi:hypothetical protein